MNPKLQAKMDELAEEEFIKFYYKALKKHYRPDVGKKDLIDLDGLLRMGFLEGTKAGAQAMYKETAKLREALEIIKLGRHASWDGELEDKDGKYVGWPTEIATAALKDFEGE